MLTKLVNIDITSTWEEKYKPWLTIWFQNSEWYRQVTSISAKFINLINFGNVDIDKIYRLD